MNERLEAVKKALEERGGFKTDNVGLDRSIIVFAKASKKFTPSNRVQIYMSLPRTPERSQLRFAYSGTWAKAMKFQIECIAETAWEESKPNGVWKGQQ